MGLEVPIYVPDRVAEGYGPTPEVFRRLKDRGVELVVTVDCGAAADDALATAAAIGLQVVVIDHHLMRTAPGSGLVIVNPNRPDCGSGQGGLAAAGVTFVLLVALNREARARGMFAGLPEPDLRQWLDLAALGAVCDVTAMVGFNRALTAQGLRVMSRWRNPGLAALMDVAGAARGQATAYDAGFVLGPRINAGGRIGRADLGARLLATDDAIEAAALARELDVLNAGRRTLEREMLEQAVRAIEQEANFDPDAAAIIVAREDWAPGVIGIVAGRLRERYRKPVMVVAIDRAADIGRGSGRSQAGVNLGRAVQAAWEGGLILSGGGHAMAAGLTLRPAAIPELRQFLCEQLAGESAACEDTLDIDALVGIEAATPGLLAEFEGMSPFGNGNPEPLLATSEVRSEGAQVVRGGHVRCTLTQVAGLRLKAIAWRAEDTELGRRLLAGGGAVHVVGRLKADNWNGRTGVQMEIEDVADPRQVGGA